MRRTHGLKSRDQVLEQEERTPEIEAAAKAFADDWEVKNRFFQNSPISQFLEYHEIAGSPNELTITGVADVIVKLGDLRALVRLLK